MTELQSLSSIRASRGSSQPDSLAISGTVRAFAISTLLIALGSLFGPVLFSGAPLGWDTGIILDCARLIVHGWVPYIDYVEMNPPMAHYINTLPIYLASISGLEIPMAFYIFVLVLAVYSATALLFLLSRLTPVFSIPSRSCLGRGLPFVFTLGF